MSPQEFKGSIPPGKTVAATLALDGGAEGPASLPIAYARSGGGGSEEDGTVVNAGQSETVSVATDTRGRLRIVVDTRGGGDTGTLTVTADGSTVDSDPITGKTTWVYAIDA